MRLVNCPPSRVRAGLFRDPALAVKDGDKRLCPLTQSRSGSVSMDRNATSR